MALSAAKKQSHRRLPQPSWRKGSALAEGNVTSFLHTVGREAAADGRVGAEGVNLQRSSVINARIRRAEGRGEEQQTKSPSSLGYVFTCWQNMA